MPRSEYLGWDAYKRDWQDFFDSIGPITLFEVQNLTVNVDGNLAYSYSFQHYVANTKAGGTPKAVGTRDITVRVTDVYRKRGGPEYWWGKFFWFNAGYFVIMIASVVAYDIGGGSWVILPLAWAIERFCNAFWHLWWTIHFREYSPGLVSSILIWMDSYFVVRYRPVEEVIATRTLWGAVIIGLLAATFLAFYIPVIKGSVMRARVGGA
ncbi:MAG: hypothetical protein JOZ33_08740 [Acidobacteriaceae bacterium]|nr:hypothetical protein [Acidobacteriaceae bacterium]